METDANIKKKFYPVEYVLINLLKYKNINYKVTNVGDLLCINVSRLKNIENIVFELKKELPELHTCLLLFLQAKYFELKKELPELSINLKYENNQLRLSIGLCDIILKENKKEKIISNIKGELFGNFTL